MENRFAILAAIVLLIALCLVGFGMYSYATPEYTTDEVRMVQPDANPWSASRDAHYAQEVNVPNSEANQNNAEADLNQALAEKAAAEATAIELQAQIEASNAELDLVERNAEFVQNGVLFALKCATGMAVLVLLVTGVAFVVNKQR